MPRPERDFPGELRKEYIKLRRKVEVLEQRLARVREAYRTFTDGDIEADIRARVGPAEILAGPPPRRPRAPRVPSPAR